MLGGHDIPAMMHDEGGSGDETESLMRPGEFVRKQGTGAPLHDRASLYFFACIFISSLPSFMLGFSVGFSSPTTAAVFNASGSGASDATACVFHNGTWNAANADKINCELRLSDGMTTWFGSIINFGALLGAMAGGHICDSLGRKRTMIAALFFYLAGWLCCDLAPCQDSLQHTTPGPDGRGWDKQGLAASDEIAAMCLGCDNGAIVCLVLASRVLIGVAVGLVCTSVSAYQTEVSPTDIRGAVGSCFQLSIVAGLVSAYSLGVLFNWRILSRIMLGMGAAGLVLTPFAAESPVWLLHKNRWSQARKNLLWLRTDASAEACEAAVDAGVAAGMQAWSQEDAGTGKSGDLMMPGAARSALVIGIGLMFAQQWSGINAVMFYCGIILESIFPEPRRANEYAIGIQVMQMAVTLVATFLTDRAGRKPLLCLAALGQAVASATLAAYFLSQKCTGERGVGDGIICEPVMSDKVALLSLYGYVMAYACGMGSIPWFLMGELFPAPVKGLAMAVCTAVNWSLAFSVTKSVTILRDVFGGGPHGMGCVFGCYGTMSLLTVVLVVRNVPETKGRSLEEIQLLLEPLANTDVHGETLGSGSGLESGEPTAGIRGDGNLPSMTPSSTATDVVDLPHSLPQSLPPPGWGCSKEEAQNTTDASGEDRGGIMSGAGRAKKEMRENSGSLTADLGGYSQQRSLRGERAAGSEALTSEGSVAAVAQIRKELDALRRQVQSVGDAGAGKDRSEEKSSEMQGGKKKQEIEPSPYKRGGTEKRGVDKLGKESLRAKSGASFPSEFSLGGSRGWAPAGRNREDEVAQGKGRRDSGEKVTGEGKGGAMRKDMELAPTASTVAAAAAAAAARANAVAAGEAAARAAAASSAIIAAQAAAAARRETGGAGSHRGSADGATRLDPRGRRRGDGDS